MERGTSDTHDGTTDGTGEETLGRRTYLKLAGTVAALGMAATGQAAAANTETYGFGEGGYGAGPYGGVSSFSVHTEAASNVGTTLATLNGSLEYLEGADSAACSFEWRRSGASVWNTTAEQQRTTLGGFSAGVTGLTDGVEYEYRAAGTASDGDSDVGSTTRFTTETSNEGPTVERYTVTEAGSSDPHVEITADWSVADADGNLDTVVVKVINATGSLGDASATNVSGSTASGTSTLDVRHVDGQTFDVVLTVIDTYGRDRSEVKSVTE